MTSGRWPRPDTYARSMDTTKRVEVSLWTCLMAIRYGMGRRTAANEDAADLARQVWDDLDEHTKDQLRTDALRLDRDGFEREAWEWMYQRR